MGEFEYYTHLYNIFKKVHSIKGTAGTCELFMLTTIFQRFQEHLTVLMDAEVDYEAVAKSVKFLEVGSECLNDYKNDSEEVEKYTSIIEEMEVEGIASNGKVLLVDMSPVLKKMCINAAEGNSMEVAVAPNGATAMIRLLSERFDLILASRHARLLDGESLLQGVRVMKTLNQNCKLALVSSDTLTAENYKSYNEHKIDAFTIDDNFLKTIKRYFALNFSPAPEPANFPYKNVVVVEDDIMLQKILQRIFGEVPTAELTLSASLKASIDNITIKKPDLIVLDYYLTDCVGPDILEKLHGLGGTGDTPVIFMTASPENINVVELRKFGNVKGIIEKPFKVRSLLDEIARFASS